MQMRGLKIQAELQRDDRQKKKEVTVFPNVRGKNHNDLYNTPAHNDEYVLKIFY